MSALGRKRSSDVRYEWKPDAESSLDWGTSLTAIRDLRIEIPNVDGASIRMECRELLRFPFRTSGIFRPGIEIVWPGILDALFDVASPVPARVAPDFSASIEGAVVRSKDTHARVSIDSCPPNIAPVRATDWNIAARN